MTLWLLARVCLLVLLLLLPSTAVVYILYALLLLGVAAAVLGVLIFVCRKTPSKVLGDGGKAGGSPLRVAFVHPDLGIGGAENLMVNAAVALQKKGHTVRVYTAHHDESHCFAETRGDGALASCITVHGDWLPRSLLRTGKGQVLCAIARTAFASLVLLLTGEADVIFVDQVRCLPLLPPGVRLPACLRTVFLPPPCLPCPPVCSQSTAVYALMSSTSAAGRCQLWCLCSASAARPCYSTAISRTSCCVSSAGLRSNACIARQSTRSRRPRQRQRTWWW